MIRKTAGTTEFFLRRDIRRPYYGAGFGPASTGATYLRSSPGAVADMVKLRGQLLVHRYRVGQSSLSTALCHGSHASADVVQFRPSLFRFPASPLDRVDGGEQAFASTGRVLRRRLFLRQCDLHLVDLGAD
jgi:hypothetical protein